MRHKHRPIFSVGGISIWHTPAKKNRPTRKDAPKPVPPYLISQTDAANAVALFCRREYKDVYLFKGNFGVILQKSEGELQLIRQNSKCSRCNRGTYPNICGVGSQWDCLNYY